MSAKKIIIGLLAGTGLVALAASGAVAMKHGGGHGFGHGMMGGMHKMRMERMKEKFKKADVDGDGFVSKTEFEGMRSSRFDEKDSNDDGFIDAAELDKAVTAKVGARADRLLKKFDKNGDGSVSKDEIVATLSAKMSPRIKRRMGRHMKRMDENWDGKVSKAEFEIATSKKFARKDKNGDGKVSLEEMMQRGHHGMGRGGMMRGSGHHKGGMMGGHHKGGEGRGSH